MTENTEIKHKNRAACGHLKRFVMWFRVWRLKVNSYGMMPNQAIGFVGKDSYSFRARHGEWSLEINGNKVAEGEGEELGEYKELPGWWEKEDTNIFVKKLLYQYYT